MPGVYTCALNFEFQIHDKGWEKVFTVGYHEPNTNPPPFSRQLGSVGLEVGVGSCLKCTFEL